MKRVIIESPYGGNVAANVKYAKQCMADSLSRDEAPIASHLLYTQEDVLDDNNPAEREKGINAGLAWLGVAELHVFYVDYGMSKGMIHALLENRKSETPIEFRLLKPHEKI